MKKRFLIFAGVVLVLGAVGVLLIVKPDLRNRLAFWQKTENAVPVSGVPLVLPTREETAAETSPVKESSSAEEPAEISAGETVAVTELAEPYVSPINFAALQEKNPDIYAWLSIEGSDISYPVLQSADDSFYLDHDENREANSEGAIFSESAYNGTSFEDSITVLYGHHMKSGRMFGNLQAMFSDPELIEKYKNIVLYTPEKELRYRVFAAVPYDSRHIAYNFGNKGERGMLGFLYSLSSVKSLDAYVNEEESVSSEDKLLVLSTCLMGDRTKRFIVVAKQILPE